jgi:transcription antitermination factor NusG
MPNLPQSRLDHPCALDDFQSTENSCADLAQLQKWYAVFTLARHEKRVVTQCADRQIECFLPLYKVRHRWKNRRDVDLELPLFPNYSFVHIDPQRRTDVLRLPGVVSIVSSRRELLPLPDNFIHSLRAGLLERRIEPHPELALGDRVRIMAGPMAGVEGILDRQKNGLRVVLRLEMLSRSLSVEVGAAEIEWCDPRVYNS